MNLSYDRVPPADLYEQMRRARKRESESTKKPARSTEWKLIAIGCFLFACFALSLFFARHAATPAPTPVAVPPPIAAATPAPAVVTATPVPVQPVPRAEPVAGPLTKEGQPMFSGRQYYVTMPDGRTLLVNYRGFVPHACMLPRQHGINNAMYTDAATGLNWIWTVPASASNVPQWIDP
jgi:hypothetical protein